MSRLQRALAELIQPTQTRQSSHAYVPVVYALTALVALVVLMNPWAFFTDAAAGETVVRQFELGLSVIGWVLLLVAPPVIVTAYAAGDRYIARFLGIAALWWPLSIVAIQVTLRAMYGEWYLGYYQDRPYFLLTDIVVPAVYYYIHTQLRAQTLQELSELESERND